MAEGISKLTKNVRTTELVDDRETGKGKVKPQDKNVEKRDKRKMSLPDRRFDWPKQNYFETMCLDSSEGREGNMKSLVHRLVYIGKLNENIEDRIDVGNHHDTLIKNLQNNFQTEPITGLMLVYLKHIVHVVEASSDMITKIMQDIVNAQQTKDGGFLQQAKILVISHDISTRLYQQWNFRTLDIQAARMEAYETAEADKVIMDLLCQLLKLGNKLAITPKISLKTALDSLHEKFPDLLPQQAHLHYLMEENDTTMMSPEEYLSMYEKPFDMTLESELVWPLATKLFPYN